MNERQPFSTGEAIALSSPSGHMSKRARNAALKRLALDLFRPEGLPAPTCPQPTNREMNLRRAKELREVAARGMCVRKYMKEAERLEAL